MKHTVPLALLLAVTCSCLPASVTAKSMAGAVRNALAKKAPASAVKNAEKDVASGKPRDVIISRSRHPAAAAHIDHAQRNGQPTVLHVDREGVAGRRHASTGRVRANPKPAPGYDRDEYPLAFTREGGHNANVRFIDPRDNRGAGATMRAQTHDLPDGAKIRVIVGK
jgi:hypothetical protein